VGLTLCASHDLTALDSVKGDTSEHDALAHIVLITNTNKFMTASFKRGWVVLVFLAIPCTPYLLQAKARNTLFLIERTPGQDSEWVAVRPPYPRRFQNLGVPSDEEAKAERRWTLNLVWEGHTKETAPTLSCKTLAIAAGQLNHYLNQHHRDRRMPLIR
jgi:hypothetical protein